MRQLVVTAAVLEALARELEAWRPREACGFLLGRAAWAHHVAPTLNAASGTGGFAIPDHEVLRVQALAGSEELVAIYHSHPSGRTELSQGDRTALEHATLPWLIVTADELVGYAPASAAPMAVAVATPTTIRAELRDVTATRSDAKSRHAVRAPSRRRLIRAAASARAVLPPRSSWTQAGMSRARRSAPAARPREQWASGRAAPGDCRFRSRGVYRVYVISLAKGHGGSRAMRPASRNGSPGTFSDDGNRIVGLFELSRDGSTWDDDLAITYRRAAWKPPSFPATRVTPLDALAGDAAAAQFQPVLAQTAVASATRPPQGDEMSMATRVADFVLIQDHESVIGPNGAASAPDTVVFPTFGAPGAIGDDAVLAFRVTVRGGSVELTIRFNGAALITDMVLDSIGDSPSGPQRAARTFHEVISQTAVREQGNRLEMSLDFNHNPNGQIRVSDVVLWYRKLA